MKMAYDYVVAACKLAGYLPTPRELVHLQIDWMTLLFARMNGGRRDSSSSMFPGITFSFPRDDKP